MIANWVKETSTTTGTGTITLAGAVSGFCSFSDVFSDGMIVRYQILDANGTSRENGYGTFTTSGTTLSRDTIIETLVGGAYDASAPAALTLTSGTHTVTIAADSNAFMPTPMGVQDTSKILSRHWCPNTGSQTDTLVADQQLAIPFLLDRTLNLSQIGIYVSTGVDATTSEVGITQCIDGIPGTAYLASAAILTTTTQSGTFVLANVTDIILQPGWYFTHIVSDGAIVCGGVTSSENYLATPLDNYNDTNRALPGCRLHLNGVTSGVLSASPETVTNVAADATVPYMYMVSA